MACLRSSSPLSEPLWTMIIKSKHDLRQFRWHRVGIIAIAIGVLTSNPAMSQQQDQYRNAPVTYEQPVREDFRDPASSDDARAGELWTKDQSRTAEPPLRLRNADSKSEAADSTNTTWFGSFLSMLGSLSVVLALFFAIAWFTKRQLPAGGTALPREVLDVLGRAPLGPRQNVHLVQLGNRLLLVAVSPNSAQTLAEVTDQHEIDQLVGLCTPSRSPRNGRGLLDFISRPTRTRPEVSDV